MKKFTLINENIEIKELSTGKWASLIISDEEVFSEIKKKVGVGVTEVNSNMVVMMSDAAIDSLISYYNTKFDTAKITPALEKDIIKKTGYFIRIKEYFNDGYNVVFINLKITY